MMTGRKHPQGANQNAQYVSNTLITETIAESDAETDKPVRARHDDAIVARFERYNQNTDK